MAAEIQTVPIAEIKIGERRRKDMGDLDALAEWIRDEGLFQPIGITEEKVLIFGMRRLQAVRDILKRKTIEARVLNVSSVLAGERIENESQKPLTLSERHAIRKALEAEIGERRGRTPQAKENVGKSPQLKGQKTRDLSSGQAGFRSTDEARAVERIMENGTPEMQQAMDQQLYPVSTLANIAGRYGHAAQNRILAGGAEGVHAAVCDRPKQQKEDQQTTAKTDTSPPPAARYAASKEFDKGLGAANRWYQELRRRWGPEGKIEGAMTAMLGNPRWDHGQTSRMFRLVEELATGFDIFEREMNAYLAEHGKR